MQITRAVACTAAVMLALPAAAWAHASISPAVAKAKTLQEFTLSVPTEKGSATTTKIELTPPANFGIDSFAPSPGWKRTVQQVGSGESAAIQKVTWSGGSTPAEEDSVFHFLASPTSTGTYTFKVRQTYSDGSVVDWTGPESSDSPAPTTQALGSFGGSGGTSVLAIAALVLAVIALVLGVAGVLARTGRPLA